jgi:hypothetical protein
MAMLDERYVGVRRRAFQRCDDPANVKKSASHQP